MSDEIWASLAKAAEALSPVFLAVLSWVSVRIAQLVDAKVKNEHVAGVLHRLDDAVTVAVREVEQVVVTELKAARSDGILNPDERLRVKGAALAAARSYIGFKGLLEIGKILGLKTDELDRLVEARVEAAVYEMRVERGPVLNGTSKPTFRS
ncbi:MAG: hypothetical protein ACOY0T_15835 [Myxococcota bacterium]